MTVMMIDTLEYIIPPSIGQCFPNTTRAGVPDSICMYVYSVIVVWTCTACLCVGGELLIDREDNWMLV